MAFITKQNSCHASLADKTQKKALSAIICDRASPIKPTKLFHYHFLSNRFPILGNGQDVGAFAFF